MTYSVICSFFSLDADLLWSDVSVGGFCCTREEKDHQSGWSCPCPQDGFVLWWCICVRLRTYVLYLSGTSYTFVVIDIECWKNTTYLWDKEPGICMSVINNCVVSFIHFFWVLDYLTSCSWWTWWLLNLFISLISKSSSQVGAIYKIGYTKLVTNASTLRSSKSLVN